MATPEFKSMSESFITVSMFLKGQNSVHGDNKLFLFLEKVGNQQTEDWLAIGTIAHGNLSRRKQTGWDHGMLDSCHVMPVPSSLLPRDAIAENHPSSSTKHMGYLAGISAEQWLTCQLDMEDRRSVLRKAIDTK